MGMKRGVWAAAVVAAVMVVGCGTLDRAAYDEEVVWTEQEVVTEVTTPVVVTNRLASTVAGADGLRETVWIDELATNNVRTFETNTVPVAVTNLVARPSAEAVIEGVGAATNLYAPGLGSVLALVLGGLYHGYRQLRNRRVNEALVQGVETARAILETTPQGRDADARFVRWLKRHQREAGVLSVVSGLVERHGDHPAAKLTAKEILEPLDEAA